MRAGRASSRSRSIWGVYPADLPYKTGYTTKFVNQGHGLELKKQLTGQ